MGDVHVWDSLAQAELVLSTVLELEAITPSFLSHAMRKHIGIKGRVTSLKRLIWICSNVFFKSCANLSTRFLVANSFWPFYVLLHHGRKLCVNQLPLYQVSCPTLIPSSTLLSKCASFYYVDFTMCPAFPRGWSSPPFSLAHGGLQTWLFLAPSGFFSFCTSPGMWTLKHQNNGICHLFPPSPPFLLIPLQSALGSRCSLRCAFHPGHPQPICC